MFVPRTGSGQACDHSGKAVDSSERLIVSGECVCCGFGLPGWLECAKQETVKVISRRQFPLLEAPTSISDRSNQVPPEGHRTGEAKDGFESI
jgi:hypothetical protein